MKTRIFPVAAVATGLVLLLSIEHSSRLQGQAPDAGSARKESPVTHHASGTFEVKLTPQPPEPGADVSLGRMTIEKQIHGDLEASSKGQMLTGMTATKGSAGYVAIEQVSGKLGGRRGTFILQHTGTMTRGEPQLTITVVPDSGTEELAGLSGVMTIDVADGKHSYQFDYSLPGF